MTEMWKAVKGYESLYEVSNLGNVRSLDRIIKLKRNGTTLRKGRILTLFYEEKKGYCQVALTKDGKAKNIEYID